jgi:Asp-tRNA(Asn)/Glu-tRNA(Gln) amidotransferase A subunit family amidase
MPSSPVDRTADVDRRRSLARSVAAGGPWVRWRETARAEATAGGRPAGPLERTLVAVKDLVAVAGLPLGAGTPARAGAPPSPRDAGIVARLRAAGAVVLGTVTLHELAFGTTGINDHFGFPTNPADGEVDRIPGGSSSGSAVAVADGSCDLAVGTDTGGSVRIPAALCGVVGFKPARASYPLEGVLPLSPSLDHVGLLARTLPPVVTAHQALTGTSVDAGLAIQRIGVDRAGLEAAAAPVAAAVERVLRTLSDGGAELVDVAWPDAERVRDVSTTVMFGEAAEVHRALLAEAGGLIGADVVERLRRGAAIDEATRAAASADALAITREVQAALAGVDAVVGPTVPITAPTVAEARSDPAGVAGALVSNTRLANVAGVPALSLPVPLRNGAGTDLPVGLQVTAASDRQTLGIGLALLRLPAW